MLRRAVLQLSGPVAVRYPRGGEGDYREAWSGQPADRLSEGRDLTILTYGTMACEAERAARRLAAENGLSVEVLKLNRIAPLPWEPVLESVKKTGRLVVAEDCLAFGSVGEQISAALAKAQVCAGIRLLNLGQRFVQQGTVPQLRRSLGLDAQGIYEAAVEVFDDK